MRARAEIEGRPPARTPARGREICRETALPILIASLSAERRAPDVVTSLADAVHLLLAGVCVTVDADANRIVQCDFHYVEQHRVTSSKSFTRSLARYV